MSSEVVEHEVSRHLCISRIEAITPFLKGQPFSNEVKWGSSFGFEHAIDTFIDECMLRSAFLLEDTANMLANDRLAGASATARSSLETCVLILEFIRRFRSAIVKSDRSGLKEVTRAFFFSSAEFQGQTNTAATNIMDAIRNSDKNHRGIVTFYGVLCEAVHPNWIGRAVSKEFEELDWSRPEAQRLLLAIVFTASIAEASLSEARELCVFIAKNKKNIKNTILFK